MSTTRRIGSDKVTPQNNSMREIPFHEIDPVFTYGELKIYLLTDEAGDPALGISLDGMEAPMIGISPSQDRLGGLYVGPFIHLIAMRARPELFSNMQDNSFEVVCTDRPFELMVGNGLVAIDRTSENGVDSIRVYDSVNDDEPVFDHDFPQGSVEDQ